MTDADAWDRAYREGLHTRQWDTPWCSPELAGALAGLGILSGTALDIGCGTGSDALYLAQQGFLVTGVDLSSTALRIAGERAADIDAEVTWLIGDALSLPVADAAFSLVTDRGCLHHIAELDRPQYASELARVLAPGGVTIIRGMCEGGRQKTPVTHEALRAMTSELPLAVRAAMPFDMVGVAGSAPATFAILERRAHI